MRVPSRIRVPPVTSPPHLGEGSTTPRTPAVSATATDSQGRGRDGPLADPPCVPCLGRKPPYGRTFMNEAPTCCQSPLFFTNQVTLTGNFWRIPLTLKGYAL